MSDRETGKLRNRKLRAATGEIVQYPIRVNHIDGSWTLTRSDDERNRGVSLKCEAPLCPICHVCDFCMQRPPVAVTDDLYTICDECGQTAEEAR